MSGSSRKRERQILGAPLVPPPRLTSILNTVRRRLLGAHRRAAPPSVRVLAILAKYAALGVIPPA